MKMTLKECLIIGLIIITVVHSDKCYHTKCRTGEYIYVDCDRTTYRCRKYSEYSGWSGSCTYKGFETINAYVYCSKGQTCFVEPETGQASCQGEADDYSLDFDYTPIVYGITAASVLAIALAFLCWYRYKRSNDALRFGNQRVLAAQPVTYNTAVPPTTATQYPTTSYPPPGQYPPAQYPPSVGSYPPPAAQYPPPAAQYPPAQYPPPPAQYPPPAAQYPPPPGGYPPPASDQKTPLPGECSEVPSDQK